MTAHRRIFALSILFAAATAAVVSGGCQKKKPAPAAGTPGFERRPYTPIPPPPTRTLKPGEPTPLPTLPG